MNNAPSPITDSPWFWAYLFTTFALVALAIANPKFSRRQAQIERQYHGRRAAAQQLDDTNPSPENAPGGPTSTLITLRPLYLALAIATAITWLLFWRSRTRPAHTTLNPEP